VAKKFCFTTSTKPCCATTAFSHSSSSSPRLQTRSISTSMRMRNAVSLRSSQQTPLLKVRLSSTHGYIACKAQRSRHLLGHYRALEWSEAKQEYVKDPNLGILVEVEVSVIVNASTSLSTQRRIHRKWRLVTPSSRRGARAMEGSRSPHMKLETILYVSPRTTRRGFPTPTYASILTSWSAARDLTRSMIDPMCQS
jgi:hypothetical protein